MAKMAKKALALAKARYVRVTPRKVGQILELVRGASVESALVTLGFSKKHVAKQIEKTVRSAVANAIQGDSKLDVEDLFIKEALVGPGPIMKRWLPRAQGRATPILKRSCHITIILGAKEHKKKAARPRKAGDTKTALAAGAHTKASRTTVSAKPAKRDAAPRPTTKAPAKRMRKATKRGG
jgi:large subunit ribosomal protein L22